MCCSSMFHQSDTFHLVAFNWTVSLIVKEGQSKQKVAFFYYPAHFCSQGGIK